MTTYAPKFPEITFKDFDLYKNTGPIARYMMLCAMRNAKVSIGAKLNYSKDVKN